MTTRSSGHIRAKDHGDTAVRKVIGRAPDGKRGSWRVVADNGKIRTIKAAPSSMRAMDEAMRMYGCALQRLADR